MKSSLALEDERAEGAPASLMRAKRLSASKRASPLSQQGKAP